MYMMIRPIYILQLYAQGKLSVYRIITIIIIIIIEKYGRRHRL